MRARPPAGLGGQPARLSLFPRAGDNGGDPVGTTRRYLFPHRRAIRTHGLAAVPTGLAWPPRVKNEGAVFLLLSTARPGALPGGRLHKQRAWRCMGTPGVVRTRMATLTLLRLAEPAPPVQPPLFPHRPTRLSARLIRRRPAPTQKRPGATGPGRERDRGFEPPRRAWEARMLPLHQSRVTLLHTAWSLLLSRGSPGVRPGSFAGRRTGGRGVKCPILTGDDSAGASL